MEPLDSGQADEFERVFEAAITELYQAAGVPSPLPRDRLRWARKVAAWKRWHKEARRRRRVQAT